MRGGGGPCRKRTALHRGPYPAYSTCRFMAFDRSSAGAETQLQIDQDAIRRRGRCPPALDSVSRGAGIAILRSCSCGAGRNAEKAAIGVHCGAGHRRSPPWWKAAGPAKPSLTGQGKALLKPPCQPYSTPAVVCLALHLQWPPLQSCFLLRTRLWLLALFILRGFGVLL